MNRAGHSRGFTIVELLIVIVVIGILAAITVVAFTGVQARARDAQRSSDLATIQKALELFRAEKGGYPACGNPGSVYTVGSASDRVCAIHDLTILYTGGYLKQGIRDPRNSGANVYFYAVGFRNNGYGACSADNSMNYILGNRFEGNGNGAVYNCWSNDLNWYGGTNNS